jgi:methionyl-tRNA formyltransferase
MRIIYLGNNWVGWQILKWLRAQGEEVVALVIHPPERCKYGEEIIESAGLEGARIFYGSQLRSPDVIETVRELKPEIGISALFGYILHREFLNSMPAGCINIHPGLLPYNRGAHPNVWSLVDRTPAGVTVHYIDEGVDTGDIIAQSQVAVDLIDTGESLYRKLEENALDLFKETWPLIRSGRAPRIAQNGAQGTFHNTTDLQRIDEVDLDRSYPARQLIDIIRARTFPPYPGVYFTHGGRKVYLRLELVYEEQLTRKRIDGTKYRD